eukprot:6080538-Pyramimonas_sp.AAC.1
MSSHASLANLWTCDAEMCPWPNSTNKLSPRADRAWVGGVTLHFFRLAWPSRASSQLPESILEPKWLPSGGGGG